MRRFDPHESSDEITIAPETSVDPAEIATAANRPTVKLELSTTCKLPVIRAGSSTDVEVGRTDRVKLEQVMSDPVRQSVTGELRGDLRTCHALGCGVSVAMRHVMCWEHWSMVPPTLRAELEAGTRLSEPWLFALRLAIARVATAERRMSAEEALAFVEEVFAAS